MENQKGILSFDPRTKIILLLGVNIFVFTNHNLYAEIGIIIGIVFLLILCGVYKIALKTLVSYGALLIIQYFLLPHSWEFLLNSLNILVITCRKLLPCVSLGALMVQTTPIRLLMYALQKWHVPRSFIIPLAITIRYFPTLSQEYHSIKDAVKLRQVWGLRKIEFLAIPIILSASSTADELSQAIIVRGIDNPVSKTCCDQLQFQLWDWIFCILAFVLMFLPIVLH